MKKDLHIDNVIDFESAKKTYLKKKAAEEKAKAMADDQFSWDKIRDLKVKIVCRDKR